MVTTTYSTVTTVLEIKDYGEGKVEIKEVQSDQATIPDLHSNNRKTFDFSLPLGSIQIQGYYDVDDLEIGAYVLVFGTQIGPKYTAGVKNGLNFGIDIGFIGGSVGIFVSGNKLRGRFSVKAPFVGEKSDEFDLLTL